MANTDKDMENDVHPGDVSAEGGLTTSYTLGGDLSGAIEPVASLDEYAEIDEEEAKPKEEGDLELDEAAGDDDINKIDRDDFLADDTFLSDDEKDSD